MSLPPYSPGTVMPSSPISPSLGHRSCGNTFSWSICVRARRDLGVGEAAYRVAQCVDFFA